MYSFSRSGAIRGEEERGRAMRYRIRVQGHLDPSWQYRFEGWRIEQQNAGTSLLSGTLPDQAALQGMLLQLIRLSVTLFSLDTNASSGGEETAERP